MVNRSCFILWKFLEPLLFGLIGAEVDFNFITLTLVGKLSWWVKNIVECNYVLAALVYYASCGMVD